MKIKRRVIQKVRNWLLVLLLVISVGFSYKIYVEKDWFSIQEYVIVGVSEDEKKEIIERLQKVSSGVVFFILPRDKILTYSHETIVSIVSDVVPSRYDVIINPSSLQSLRIEVVEFVPVMKISDIIGITKDGVVFPTKKSLKQVPYFDSASTTESFKENGFVFNKLSSFDEEYIEELSLFIEKVSTVLFPISKIKIDEKKDISLFGQDERSRVLVTNKTDLDKGWSTLVSAIDTNPLKASLEKERENLLYIDLRFGNKVFYKFGKNNEFQNASSVGIIDDHDTNSTTTLSQ